MERVHPSLQTRRDLLVRGAGLELQSHQPRLRALAFQQTQLLQFSRVKPHIQGWQRLLGGDSGWRLLGVSQSQPPPCLLASAPATVLTLDGEAGSLESPERLHTETHTVSAWTSD